MREFILRARKAYSSPFDIDDLPGAGRMDIVASFIANCLWISNNLRTDTIAHAVLEGPRDPPKTVSFHGGELKGFPYDNKGITELINNALKNATAGKEVQASPGVNVSKLSFEAMLKSKNNIFYLHNKGEDIRKITLPADCVFVMGDYIGMPDKSERFLDRLGAKKLSLGKTMLLASQCPVIINYELDLRLG